MTTDELKSIIQVELDILTTAARNAPEMHLETLTAMYNKYTWMLGVLEYNPALDAFYNTVLFGPMGRLMHNLQTEPNHADAHHWKGQLIATRRVLNAITEVYAPSLYE